MWQWKQQMRAKFGTDDVTRPSKRFAFDGLKLSCKKKTSSYKNWLLRCKEVAHKHRQRFFKLPEPASLFTYHRQRWFFVSARSGKLFYIWRYLVLDFFKTNSSYYITVKMQEAAKRCNITLQMRFNLLYLYIHVMLADPAIQSRLPLGRNKQISNI